MNSTLSKFLCFTAGAAIGSVVTWKLVKTKYEQLMHESDQIMREVYLNDSDNSDEEEEPDEHEEYENVVAESGYVPNQNEEEEEEEVDKPYVISPEEFDDGDYEKESLDYYEGDGVLADNFGDVVENVDDMVGEDFASHFGEYEKDTVYVRNDELETDFEICRDLGSFSEV